MIELLSPADAARITGLSIDTIYDAVASGELVASKVRRRILIQQHDLVNWIDENRIQPSVGPQRPAPSQRPAPPTGGFRQAVRETRAA